MSSSRALVILALVTAAAIALRPGIARACSHPFGLGMPYLVLPADGDLDVPTNARVRILWPDASGPPCAAGTCGATPSFSLRTADGTPVGTSDLISSWGISYGFTWTTVMAPAAALAPMTAYEVVYIADDATETVLGRFTTGAGIDGIAPGIPVAAATVSTRHECTYADDFGCCDAVPVLRARVELAEAGEAVVYDAREGATVVASAHPGPLEGLLACSMWNPDFDVHAGPTSPPPFWMTGGAHELVITAIDRAGNESAPAYVLLAGSCDPAAPDGGGGPAGVDASGGAADGDRGCGCNTAPGGGWLPAAIVVLPAAIHRRRRMRGAARAAARPR